MSPQIYCHVWHYSFSYRRMAYVKISGNQLRSDGTRVWTAHLMCFNGKKIHFSRTFYSCGGAEQILDVAATTLRNLGWLEKKDRFSQTEIVYRRTTARGGA